MRHRGWLIFPPPGISKLNGQFFYCCNIKFATFIKRRTWLSESLFLWKSNLELRNGICPDVHVCFIACVLYCFFVLLFCVIGNEFIFIINYCSWLKNTKDSSVKYNVRDLWENTSMWSFCCFDSGLFLVVYLLL